MAGLDNLASTSSRTVGPTSHVAGETSYAAHTAQLPGLHGAYRPSSFDFNYYGTFNPDPTMPRYDRLYEGFRKFLSGKTIYRASISYSTRPRQRPRSGNPETFHRLLKRDMQTNQTSVKTHQDKVPKSRLHQKASHSQPNPISNSQAMAISGNPMDIDFAMPLNNNSSIGLDATFSWNPASHPSSVSMTNRTPEIFPLPNPQSNFASPFQLPTPNYLTNCGSGVQFFPEFADTPMLASSFSMSSSTTNPSPITPSTLFNTYNSDLFMSTGNANTWTPEHGQGQGSFNLDTNTATSPDGIFSLGTNFIGCQNQEFSITKGDTYDSDLEFLEKFGF